ncbi:MAG: carbon-nitrogen hydrolase family protein [Pseudomonadota bacterium]
MKTIVAALQMVSTFDVDANLKSAEQLLRQAADQGAQFAALPENYAVLDSDNLCRWGDEETRTGVFTTFLAEQARKCNLWILGGTIPKRTLADGKPVPGWRVRAASILVNPQGDIVARYDKMHLFDVQVSDAQGQYRESATIEPGNVPVLATTPFGKLGMTVCYDLRFPELFSLLQRQGADFFTVPSAFTWRTGEAHWEILLRARAIETQSYIIAPGQGGVHSSKRTTWGHSMIIDPWGMVLGDKTEAGPGVVLAEMDSELLQSVRNSMPIAQHKRFQVVSKP